MKKAEQEKLYQQWLKSDELEPPDGLLEPCDEDIVPETELTPAEKAQAKELGKNIFQLLHKPR